MTYSDKLKDPRWQKKRLKILERDNWRCQYCNDNKNTLHIHHFSYCDEPWESEDIELITTCEICHLIIEEFKCIYPWWQIMSICNTEIDTENGIMYLLKYLNDLEMQVFICYYDTKKKLLIHENSIEVLRFINSINE